MAERHEIAHFRHCARIRSKATNAAVYLTHFFGSGSMTATIVCSTYQNSGRNQTFWLWTDRPEDTSAGIIDRGYLASIYKHVVGQAAFSMLNYAALASGANIRCAYTLSQPNFNNVNAAWSFVSHGASGFSIRARTHDQALCLTAGSAPSDTVSSGAVCTLQQFTGALNQLWTLEDPEQPLNIYNFSPALAHDLCIASPGQSESDHQELGILAQTDDDPSAIWMGVGSSYVSGSSLGSEQRLVYPTSRGGWNQLYSQIYAGTKFIQTSYRNLATLGGSTIPRNQRSLSSSAGLDMETATGTYVPVQYEMTSGSAMSSCNKSSALDSPSVDISPYAAAINTSTDWINGDQYWIQQPQNFFDPTLPTPQDIHVAYTLGTQDMGDLGETDELSLLTPIVFRPRFRCDWTDFVCCLKIRYRPRNSSGAWGKWERVSVPANGNAAELAASPWAIPNGAAAWVPNAFATTIRSDGYREFSQPITVSQSIFAGHADDVAQILVSIRAFRMGSFDTIPGAPYHGPEAIFSSVVAPRIIVNITGMSMRHEGLALSGSITNAGRTMTLAIDGLSIQREPSSGTPTSHQIIAEPTSCSIVSESLTSLTWESVIPWPKIDANELIAALRDPGLMTVDTSDIRVVGQFATKPLGASSFVPSLPAQSETDQEVISHIGPHAALITARTAGLKQTVLQPAQTERGSRFIVAPVIVQPTNLAGSTSLVIPPVGSDLSHESASSPVLILMSDDPSWHIRDIDPVQENPVSSIIYEDDDDVIHIILMQGNLSYAYARSRDLLSASKIGSRRLSAGATLTEVPSLKFSGTMFSGQLHGVTTQVPSRLPGASKIRIETSLADIYKIPADTIIAFRTTYGTTYSALISSISSPRDMAALSEIEIGLEEVEGTYVD